MKHNWRFQNIKDNVNALTPNFWQTYVQCYELNTIMQQFDMVFIQTLKKFHIITENTMDIQFLINNHSTILLFHIYIIQINLSKNTMNMCSLLNYVPHIFSKQWTLVINHAHHLTNSQMI
jgi:hypothetical protein